MECRKCPYDPGTICEECREKKRKDTSKLCVTLLDMLTLEEVERAYLLLNRLYCGAVVTADDAVNPNAEEARLTAKLIEKMPRSEAKRVYSFAGKLYCESN